MKRFERLVLPLIGIGAVLIGVGAWRAGFFEKNPPVTATNSDLSFIGATAADEVRLRDILVLSGFIERQEQRAAIVNDDVVGQGDVVEVVAGEHAYKLRVDEITIDRVVLRVLEGPP